MSDVRLHLQNFIHCLNIFTVSKNHAHNQRTKIKLNVIVFMFREKKIYFFSKERGFYGKSYLAIQNF